MNNNHFKNECPPPPPGWHATGKFNPDMYCRPTVALQRNEVTLVLLRLA